MTYLELVGELHRECGCAGVAPTTVISQSGEAKRLVNWIRRANLYVQRLWANWKFLRCEYSKTLADGDSTAAAPTVPNAIGRGMWDYDTFFITEVGDTIKQPLVVQEWDKVKTEVFDTDTGVPWRVIVMPDNSLKFDPPSNDAHTITAEFYRQPIIDELAANDDESAIPEEFQEIILARGMIFYSNYENAPEIKQQGEETYEETLARMENSELPNQMNARYRTGGNFTVVPQ